MRTERIEAMKDALRKAALYAGEQELIRDELAKIAAAIEDAECCVHEARRLLALFDRAESGRAYVASAENNLIAAEARLDALRIEHGSLHERLALSCRMVEFVLQGVDGAAWDRACHEHLAATGRELSIMEGFSDGK